MKYPAVKIRGLKKSFGDVKALDGVELTIKQGEFLGLLGPNGAGKTTTINILTGLVTGIWTWFKGLFGFGETTTPAEQEEGGVLSFLTGMVTGVWTWFKGLFDFSSFGAGLASAAKLIFLPYTALIDLVGAVWTWFSGLFGWTDETKPKDP